MSASVIGARSAFGVYLRDLRKRKGIKSPAALARRMRGAASTSGILKRERGELKITQDYIACSRLSHKEHCATPK